MNTFHVAAALLSLAALGGYLNARLLKLPSTIGQMAIALLMSITLIALNKARIVNFAPAIQFVNHIDFAAVLLQGMLSFLLFAGSLHADTINLRRLQLPIAILATVGILIATAVTGTLFWFAAQWTGLEISYLHALLFGALIAPTDPIAVLGILSQAQAPPSIQAKIGGESLFNDGVGVVVFMTIADLLSSGASVHLNVIVMDLLRETGGGIALGLSLGWLTYRMLRSIDAYKVEVLLTLALVSGGHILAEHWHVSAPICMVAAGLVIGNLGRAHGMSDKTRRHVDLFWELLDEILNAVLFMLIGLQLLVFRMDTSRIALAGLAILAVLGGRAISVGVPITILRRWRDYEAGTIRLLTWGGLRGGISIALALSLPPSPEREMLLEATYIVVLFSVLVQGLSFGPLVRLLTK
jgi:monovalent cation:H+ antiporter, CPA1 family